MLRRTSLTVLFFLTSLRAADIQPAALDRIIETARKAWDVPGVAVAIVHGEDTIYIKGFGVKRTGSADAVTPDTRFAIGSCTKAFTTTAMALLVDEGKMGWDDSVRKHLPYFRLSDPLADANVTMRDIVCHRTGLSRNDLLWYNSPWSREEIIRKIGLVPLNRPFRSASIRTSCF
jgi:CubicO group peptidase (beta-lactamase class C family)